jgi:hypothetical protein
MKATISALLTSTEARKDQMVESQLASELSAGIPWWSKAE